MQHSTTSSHIDCQQASYVVGKKAKALLTQIDFQIPGGSFTAIIGPSGCGKTTLIKLLSGTLHPTSGTIRLAGHDPTGLKSHLPLSIGYLPQHAAFHEDLTVREVLDYGLKLRLPISVKSAQKAQWLNSIIELTGCARLLDQKVATLSGGQKRRLALAEELLGDPQFLFLDELTSGLDPNSEQEMMQWLRDFVNHTAKTVVLVTHAVGNLQYCDQVLFLCQGHLLYSGSTAQLIPHFGFNTIEEVYSHAETFAPAPPMPRGGAAEPAPLRTARPPHAIFQFSTILKRQFKLFFRDKGQWLLHLLLLISFPFLVAVFALNGLPAVRNLSMDVGTSVIDNLTERLKYLVESFEVASLVQGLSMLQVILLTLMGANNGAREIAKENQILNKELASGLSVTAYLGAKFFQIALFCLIQAGWMAWFVKTMCGFPGSFTEQFISLLMPTLAMSATCLWFSSISKTPEKASLLSIYLVGLQLPLSGAVLAMPDWLMWITRPFIAAYWGWSGYLRTLQNFRHYDVVQEAIKTTIAPYTQSIVILFLHITIALALAWWGIARRRR